MSGQSPDVVLYDSNGNALAAANAAVIPVSALMSAGSDGTDLRFLAVNSSGQQIIVGPAAAGVATSGNPVLIAGSDGTNVRTLLMDASSRQIVAGAGTAGTPTGGVLTIQGVSGGVTVPVSGTVTATNASVSTTATAVPGSATFVGGAVQAVQSGLTLGDLYPLSMTQTGLLRVDGSNVTQPVSGTVTANAGTGSFTVAQATAANLNATVTGTVTSNQGTANTLANAWSTKITDATNGPVAVKAASTAAVATDPALVVAISPNNALSLSTADVTNTGALGALNAAVQVSTSGLDTAGFQLAAGTLIGTIIPEVSFDGGTTWNTTYFDTPSSGKVATIVFASSNTATAATIVGVGGSGLSRVRVSAYSSGTANITVRATTRTDPSVLFAGPAAVAGPPSVAQIGGSVTTAAPTYTTGTLNILSLNTSGGLRIDGSGVTQPVSIASAVTVAQATAASLNATVVQGTAANLRTQTSAESATGSAPPANANYLGGSVTTSSPSYTTGQMSGLSLTLAGALRIDGSAITQPVSGTVTANAGTGNFIVVGTASDNTANSTAKLPVIAAVATTGAPTYTTGDMVPLSTDTSGNLRITGSISATNPSVGTTNATTPTSATLMGGTDGTNLRAVFTDTHGSQFIIHSPNITVIHNGATITTSNSVVIQNVGRKEITLGVNISGTVSGTTPTLTYTVSELDAVNLTTVMTGPGNTATAGPFSGTGQTYYVQMISYTGAIKVSWTITGTTPSFGGVDAWVAVKESTLAYGLNFNNSPIPLSAVNIDSNSNTMVVGFTNAGSAAVTAPVLMGGTDGTDARMALMDTSGRQVIIGSASDNTTNSTAKLPVIAAVANTSAPTYVSGDMVPLSTDTSGNLRITGSISATNPSVGTTGSAPPTSATLIGGSDGTDLRALSSNSIGYLNVDVGPNITAVLSNATLTTSGSLVIPNVGGREMTFGINITGTVSGTTPSLTVTLEELDPINLTTQMTLPGNSVSMGPYTSSGHTNYTEMLSYTGAIKVVWTVTGTTPSFGGVDLWVTQKQQQTLSYGLLQNGISEPLSVINIDPNNNTVVVGTVASGSVVSGNPILTAGSDGTDVRTILTDASGRHIVAGAGAAGSVLVGNPVQISGSDGTNTRTLLTDTSGRLVMVGAAATGVALAGNPVLIAGSDGTNAQTLRTNPVSGLSSILTQESENLRTTYAASIIGFASATTATDIFTIIGSASKIIRVTRLEISGTQTTAATIAIQIVKRSTASTAPTAITATPLDSSNAAATASVGNYTANPGTLGSQVGSPIRSFKIFIPAPATTTTPQPLYDIDFGVRNDQPIVLRGVAQSLNVNLNSTTVTGSSWSISVEWTEDSV